MHHKASHEIRQVMNQYIAKGKKSLYKKKQMTRLVSILDNIMSKQKDPRLSAIGRKQLIIYWKSTKHETDQTRREKFSILNRFFSLYNPKVTVPEPHISKEIITE